MTGLARWSLLSSQVAAASLSRSILARLDEGDLLLVAGRPGHGKTTLGLQLLLDAARDGRKAVFFTLEFTEQQARRHLRSLDEGRHGLCDKLQILTSDDISADYIIRHLSGSERGTVAVIDYLQILDQQRSKPALSDVLALGDFARQTGVVFGFISQVDRSFDPESKRLPDIRDIRLPNLVDLRLFNKAYFLHNGEARLQDVA
ncbi:AAA family ATPase [Sinorhizobium meliloti]|nr:AAA family ATPase [Sinorhizobium meliloti]